MVVKAIGHDPLIRRNGMKVGVEFSADRKRNANILDADTIFHILAKNVVIKEARIMDNPWIPLHLMIEQIRKKKMADEFGQLADSGQRRTFETGAMRDRGELKPRPDLISPHAGLLEDWHGQPRRY